MNGGKNKMEGKRTKGRETATFLKQGGNISEGDVMYV